MTLQQMLDKLRAVLGTPLPNIVRHATPATEQNNLTKYINEAAKEVAYTVHGVEFTHEQATTAGTRDYDVPASTIAIEEIRRIDDDYEYPLRRIRTLPTDYAVREGVPWAYYRRNEDITLYPIPDENGSIRFFGWRIPVDLVALTDESELREDLHYLVPILAGAIIMEAQARALAQSSDSDVGADSVSLESRTKEYSFRAKECRELYQTHLFKLRGPQI